MWKKISITIAMAGLSACASQPAGLRSTQACDSVHSLRDCGRSQSKSTSADLSAPAEEPETWTTTEPTQTSEPKRDKTKRETKLTGHAGLGSKPAHKKPKQSQPGKPVREPSGKPKINEKKSGHQRNASGNNGKGGNDGAGGKERDTTRNNR